MNRLTRLEWTYTDAPMYFITAVTHQRRRILANDLSHSVFREFCHAATAKRVFVGRYVLMPDHLHLFVCLPAGAMGLSDWVKSLKNSLSKCWRLDGTEAPHWQKGFFDHLLRSDESHAEKWRYVRENPVRAGLCSQSETWPYAGSIHPDVWSVGS